MGGCALKTQKLSMVTSNKMGNGPDDIYQGNAVVLPFFGHSNIARSLVVDARSGHTGHGADVPHICLAPGKDLDAPTHLILFRGGQPGDSSRAPRLDGCEILGFRTGLALGIVRSGLFPILLNARNTLKANLNSHGTVIWR